MPLVEKMVVDGFAFDVETVVPVRSLRAIGRRRAGHLAQRHGLEGLHGGGSAAHDRGRPARPLAVPARPLQSRGSGRRLMTGDPALFASLVAAPAFTALETALADGKDRVAASGLIGPARAAVLTLLLARTHGAGSRSSFTTTPRSPRGSGIWSPWLTFSAGIRGGSSCFRPWSAIPTTTSRHTPRWSETGCARSDASYGTTSTCFSCRLPRCFPVGVARRASGGLAHRASRRHTSAGTVPPR